MVAVACLLEEYYESGVEIQFKKGENLELIEYLEKIEFWRKWETNRNNQGNATQSKITTLISKIEKGKIDMYADQAQRYYQDNYLPIKDFEPLKTTLAELFNNGCDHSGCNFGGYYITQ